MHIDNLTGPSLSMMGTITLFLSLFASKLISIIPTGKNCQASGYGGEISVSVSVSTPVSVVVSVSV